MGVLSDFFHMGGHAGFIWPAYGIVTLVLFALFITGRRFQRSTEAELNALNPRTSRLAQSDTPESGYEA